MTVTAYVFDLDDVLLPTTRLFAQPHARQWLHSFKQTNNVHTTCIGYQKLVQPNPLLVHYVRQLRGAKYVLTNASRLHAYASLGALGLHRLVEGQLDANSGEAHPTQIKPSPARQQGPIGANRAKGPIRNPEPPYKSPPPRSPNK